MSNHFDPRKHLTLTYISLFKIEGDIHTMNPDYLVRKFNLKNDYLVERVIHIRNNMHNKGKKYTINRV